MTNISILVVDDSESDRYLIKRGLRSSQRITQVFESIDGRSALDLLANCMEGGKSQTDGLPPSLILLDVNMPLLGGMEFLQEFETLRIEKDLSSVVVMMYSSSERKEERDKAFSYDFVKGFITKGAHSPGVLEENLLEALGLSQ